jgi:hypothetical protein
VPVRNPVYERIDMTTGHTSTFDDLSTLRFEAADLVQQERRAPPSREQIALAAAAQGRGEAAAAHAAWAEQMQKSIAASAVVVEPAATVDDVAVKWTGSSS